MRSWREKNELSGCRSLVGMHLPAIAVHLPRARLKLRHCSTPEGSSHSFPLSSLVTEIYICICTLCVGGGGKGVGMGGSIYYPNFPTSFAAKGLNAVTKSCG